MLKKKETPYRKPKQKSYRGMKVDASLDTDALDKLNRIQGIRVIGVCSGHSHPTEYDEVYRGNVPQIWFKTQQLPKKVCERLRKSQDKKNGSFKCYAEDSTVNIRGTKKGTKTWWKNTVSKIENLYD